MQLIEWGTANMTPSEDLTTCLHRSICAQACIGNVKVFTSPFSTLSQ